MTLSRRQALDLLRAEGLAPSRALGQNFVVDPNTVRRIARLAGVGPGDHVVEVGAGLGSLTLSLAETGASVTAVEVDRRLLAVLRQVVDRSGVDVRLVAGDALTLDWRELLAPAPVWSLVANLPYNLATPLVLDLLDRISEVTAMVVMVQREVGERLAAAPGDGAYGAVSVKVAYWARARVVGKVGPTVFLPQPKVDSALVAIDRRAAPAVDPEVVGPERLFAVVRAGFGQRRKMLRSSLKSVGGDTLCELAGIDPSVRAETIDVQGWLRLAAASLA